MAADAKVTRRNDPALTTYQTCKTLVSGNYVVTAAGLFARRAVGFDAWHLIEVILSSSTSLDQIEQRIRLELAQALVRALADAKRADPQGFARDFPADFLALAVAGVERGILGMLTVDFYPDRTGAMRTKTNLYPPPGTRIHDDEMGFSIMGERAAIDRDYPNERLIPLLRADAPSTARALVELQIEHTPDKVGPPVSVVELTATGI